MNNSFLKQFAANIKFKYFCFDRIIIRGYILMLFFPGGVVKLLRALGFTRLSNGVMRILTNQLNGHIKKVATKQDIPIHWWPSEGGGTDGAKLAFVHNKYAKHFTGTGNHVFCILTDKEPVRTFVCRELTSKTGKRYERLYDCRKPVKQYYIYFHDALLGGPCYLKISSYLPFHAELYFNGHNAIQLQLDKQGVNYNVKENAFVDVDDPQVLEKAALSLDGRAVYDRINYWMDIFFRFDKGKYSTRSKFLVHGWYLTQVEICSNVIFKSARFCTSLFERLLDKFHRLGLPETIAQIFSRRPHRRSTSKTFWRLYYNNACIKHWFRGNSVKQYNKTGYFIRTETTINNPKSLGLQKPVLYLQAYLWSGAGCNDRFLNCCADVDVASLPVAEHEMFTKPVADHKGRNITAPDFRKYRQKALANEMLKPKYQAYGFRTIDLFNNLSGDFRNPAQIRYEMNKLRVRGVVDKQKNQSFYRVTEMGWKWLWLSICSERHFKNPMISRVMKNSACRSVEQPSHIEAGYDLLNRGLNLITQQFAVIS